jgi:adenylyl-sulfate kinase
VSTPGAIDREARATRNGHRSAVVWLTGLPASGKTTIARAVEEVLFARGVQVYTLDGDILRGGLCRDLGFSPADRSENIRRAGTLAGMFADAGMVVLAAFVSPQASQRQTARWAASAAPFVEVFVDCPLAECERRDPKHLFRRARGGEIGTLTGLSAPYESPQHPEVHLRTDRMSVEESVGTIVRYLEQIGVLVRFA